MLHDCSLPVTRAWTIWDFYKELSLLLMPSEVECTLPGQSSRSSLSSQWKQRLRMMLIFSDSDVWLSLLSKSNLCNRPLHLANAQSRASCDEYCGHCSKLRYFLNSTASIAFNTICSKKGLPFFGSLVLEVSGFVGLMHLTNCNCKQRQEADLEFKLFCAPNRCCLSSWCCRSCKGSMEG